MILRILFASLLHCLPSWANDLGATKVEVDSKRKDVTITWSRVGGTEEQRFGVEVVFLDGKLKDCRRCVVNFPANTHARTLLAGSDTWIPGPAPKAEGEGWWVRILDGGGNSITRFSSSEKVDVFAAAQGKWKLNDVDPNRRSERKVEMNTEKLPKKEFVAAAEAAVGKWLDQTGRNPWSFELKTDGSAVGGGKVGKWRLEHRQIVVDWETGWAFRFEPPSGDGEKSSRLHHSQKGHFKGMGTVARAAAKP